MKKQKTNPPILQPSNPLAIGFISLGCAKNLTDTETMMGQAVKKHKLVNDMNQADVMIVNSCSFIDSARQETVDTLIELKAWKKGSRKIILAGCYVEEVKDQVFAKYPYIDGVINLGAISQINELLENLYNKSEKKLFVAANNNNFLLNEDRFLTTPKHYAYLKIGDGCDNCCSYCRIPSLRGKAIYKSPEKIIQEALVLQKKGVKELILIAQDTTSYKWRDKNLTWLLKQDAITSFPWVRLMYCYPEKITPELIQTIKTSKNIVKYIDMPIQHINDRILKSMHRSSSKMTILEKVNLLRTEIPDIKLRTTVIVGYPGETDKEFEELHDFVKEIKFDHLGVFTYSNEPGTSSYNMRGQVSEDVKESRYHKIMGLQSKISKTLNKRYQGQIMTVLIDNLENGRRYFDAPEIDGLVQITNNLPSFIGELKKIRIKKSLEYDLIGEIV